ncbi:sodium- and chloride-dependent glycine transporter 1-like [Haliotis asinina]|uniref:sodium- and chloride-dependent glycine transporter 1-like n=1 Tax=Haliotis asinina TaxID=109174 RepID=UPI00353188D4
MDKGRSKEDDAGLPMTQSPGGKTTPLPQARDSWGRHLDYMLTMVGYSVGLGNLLRFPYICNRNGGGAFVIPYIICVFITGFPMMFLESSMSQFSRKAILHVWSFCPMFRGIGIATVAITFVYSTFYTLYLAWPIYYMVKSCSTVLPWSTCGNDWNSDLCVEDGNTIYDNNSTVQGTNSINTITAVDRWENVTLAHTPFEEFWQYNVLNVSTGLEDVGSIQWEIVGCLFAATTIIFVCIVRGIKSAGKVVYVTAVLPYFLLIAIFIATLLQPGASDGILYYVVPDFSKLLEVQVWVEACLQVFYSLGPGWGMIGTAASYKQFNRPCLRDSLILSIVSEGTSIFSGLVTFSILGVMSQKTGVPIANVVSSGPGLGFVTYPQALAQLPFPQVWSFLFFLMLLTIGLDTQFLSMEVVVTAIVDQYPKRLIKWRWLVTLVFCLISYLFTIGFCTQGGPYMFQLIDWYAASLGPMLFCTIECVAVGWIYGIKQMSRDFEMMTGKPLSPPVKILLTCVTPAVLVIVFIMTLLRYKPPTYGKYVFPSYASTIGWIIAALPLLPIPIYMVRIVRRHMTTRSFKKSLNLALSPADDWLPADVRYREEYRMHRLAGRPTFTSNIVDIYKQ